MTECKGCGNGPNEPKFMPDWSKVFVSREEFLKVLSFGLSGVIGLIAVIPGAGFVLNFLFRPQAPKWVKLGPLPNFKEGETARVGFRDPFFLPWDGVTANRSVWLRRNPDDQITVFSVSCTHLGCPVKWESKAELFMCPCHGGVYYKDGQVAGGPPLHPLPQYPVRVVANNVEIRIDTALTEG